MKKIAKFLNNKKAQSQLDKLLENLEQEGIQSLFNNKAFSFDEKDLSVQLASLLDRDLGESSLHSLEVLGDKRPSQIDQGFTRENPRGNRFHYSIYLQEFRGCFKGLQDRRPRGVEFYSGYYD